MQGLNYLEIGMLIFMIIHLCETTVIKSFLFQERMYNKIKIIFKKLLSLNLFEGRKNTFYCYYIWQKDEHA